MSWIWDEGAIVDFILIIFYIILIFLFVHMFSMFPYYTPNFKKDIVLNVFKSFAKFLTIVYKTIYSFLGFYLFYFIVNYKVYTTVLQNLVDQLHVRFSLIYHQIIISCNSFSGRKVQYLPCSPSDRSLDHHYID